MCDCWVALRLFVPNLDGIMTSSLRAFCGAVCGETRGRLLIRIAGTAILIGGNVPMAF